MFALLFGYRIRYGTSPFCPLSILTFHLRLQGAKSRIEGARGKLLASSLHVLTLTPKHVNSLPTTEILFHRTKDKVRRSSVNP